MKKVKVTIEGTILICEYASEQAMESEEGGFDSVYYMTLGWDTLKGLYIDEDEGENLIKKKGKYHKSYEYFHNLFSEDGEHPLPVEVHLRSSSYDEKFDYIIDLEDSEEFDIKKLQLIKSDYEIEPCPYFIVAEKIMYDGKEFSLTDESWDVYSEYSIDGRFCEEHTVDQFYNGGNY